MKSGQHGRSKQCPPHPGTPPVSARQSTASRNSRHAAGATACPVGHGGPSQRSAAPSGLNYSTDFATKGAAGGPLFSLDGKVVGINTAIVAQGQGIGFAVPVNIARDILKDLKEKGHVTRGWLGLSIQDITPDMAENMKLQDRQGALVGQVFPGDPADKAGIKTGDIIIAVDGRRIQDTHELLRIVASLTVGRQVEVLIIRNGREERKNVTVAERKETREIAAGSKGYEQLGLTVQEITPEMARALKLTEQGGVVITRVNPNSPADDAHLKVNDVILQVNRVRVQALKDFTAELARSGNEETVMFLIKRDEAAVFVTLRRQAKKEPGSKH